MAGTHSAAIAVAAARLIVEEGLEYGAAKRRAARDLGLHGRNGELPGNDEIEDEVRVYLDLFHADTQPAELAELRRIAADWMERLAPFRPHLTGAVWRGTATRLSSVAIDLFCDDSKSAEIALIDMRVDYDVSSVDGPRGRILDVLNVQSPSPAPRDGRADRPHRARLRRPARRAPSRRARPQRPGRPRGAALARGRGLNRRAAILGLAAVAAAAAGLRAALYAARRR